MSENLDLETEFANLLHIREGKVVRLALYSNRERALADLGLEADSA
jgi:hypothetical protein